MATGMQFMLQPVDVSEQMPVLAAAAARLCAVEMHTVGVCSEGLSGNETRNGNCNANGNGNYNADSNQNANSENNSTPISNARIQPSVFLLIAACRVLLLPNADWSRVSLALDLLSRVEAERIDLCARLEDVSRLVAKASTSSAALTEETGLRTNDSGTGTKFTVAESSQSATKPSRSTSKPSHKLFKKRTKLIQKLHTRHTSNSRIEAFIGITTALRVEHLIRLLSDPSSSTRVLQSTLNQYFPASHDFLYDSNDAWISTSDGQRKRFQCLISNRNLAPPKKMEWGQIAVAIKSHLDALQSDFKMYIDIFLDVKLEVVTGPIHATDTHSTLKPLQQSPPQTPLQLPHSRQPPSQNLSDNPSPSLSFPLHSVSQPSQKPPFVDSEKPNVEYFSIVDFSNNRTSYAKSQGYTPEQFWEEGHPFPGITHDGTDQQSLLQSHAWLARKDLQIISAQRTDLDQRALAALEWAQSLLIPGRKISDGDVNCVHAVIHWLITFQERTTLMPETGQQESAADLSSGTSISANPDSTYYSGMTTFALVGEKATALS